MAVCSLLSTGHVQVSDGGLGESSVVQLVLRLRVPDSHSDCPLGEKYGAAEEACSELVRGEASQLDLDVMSSSTKTGGGAFAYFFAPPTFSCRK